MRAPARDPRCTAFHRVLGVVRVLAAIGGLLSWAAIGTADARKIEGHVRQLSAEFVYVDLGAVDGLVAGDTLIVESGAGAGEKLVAIYVACRSASCALLAASGAPVTPETPEVSGSPAPSGAPGMAVSRSAIAVGDAVGATISEVGSRLPSGEARAREAPVVPGDGTAARGGDANESAATLSFPAERDGAPTRAAATDRRRSRRGRIRGSAALDWIVTRSEGGETLTRDPRGRFELRGRDLAARDIQIRASLRTRRATSTSADGNLFPEVRQLWFHARSTSTGLAFRGGRLLIPEAGSFAYLDGGSIGYTRSLELTLFGGRQPDWVDRSAKGAVHIAGGSARVPVTALRSAIRLSLLREIRESDRNRDWAYLEGQTEPLPVLRVHARAQLQLTRRDEAERMPAQPYPEVDPTDFEVFRSYLESRVSVSARYKPDDRFWWSLSYDESSLVSEYEATVSAEDRFDRTARNGWRTTLSLEPAALWRTQIGGSVRDSQGSDTRWSLNGSASRRRLLSWPLDAGAQLRVFDAGYSRGSTPSIEIEHASPRGYSLELRSGLHRYEIRGTTGVRSDHWVRVSSSVSLPGRVRVRLEAETSGGDNGAGTRFYGQIIRSF